MPDYKKIKNEFPATVAAPKWRYFSGRCRRHQLGKLFGVQGLEAKANRLAASDGGFDQALGAHHRREAAGEFVLPRPAGLRQSDERRACERAGRSHALLAVQAAEGRQRRRV